MSDGFAPASSRGLTQGANGTSATPGARRAGSRAPRAARTERAPGRPSAGRRRSRPSGRRSTSRMFGSPASSATNRSSPSAKPPCGGAPICSASSRKPNFSLASSSPRPSARKTPLLDVLAVDPDRARPELPPVPDEVVRLAERRSRIALDQLLVPGDEARERVVAERPALVLLVPLEEREVDDPEELVPALVDEPELSPEVEPQERRARARRALGVARGEEHGRPRLARGTPRARPPTGTSRSASAPRRPRRRRGTRDPSLPTPSRAPRAVRARRARTPSARRGTARTARPRTRRSSEPRVTSVASWISSPKRRSGLSEPYRAMASPYVMRGNGRGRGSRPERLERRDDDLLQHVEHVLALGERHLDVELAELELPVRPEILVPEAGRDLVVAVEAGDHEELLEDLRRLRQREERPGCSRTGTRKSRAPSGVAARQARRPDVEEAELLHRRRIAETTAPDRRRFSLHPLACAGRASGSGGAASRRRPPRRAGTGAASSARRSRARRRGARPRRSASSGSRSPASARRPRPVARSTNSLRISFASSAARGRALRVDDELQ